MKPLYVPLYARILGWMALNLALIAGMSYAFAARDQSGLNMLLTPSVQERTSAIAHEVAESVYFGPQEQRSLTLRDLGARYGAVFSIPDLAGSAAPASETNQVSLFAAPEPFRHGGAAMGDAHGPRPAYMEVLRSASPSGYDVIMRTPLGHGGHGHDAPIVSVVAHLPGLFGLLGFLGIGRTLVFIALVIAVSMVMWWPFSWQVTRSIRDLRSATRLMARGRLETRVAVVRRDEIGQLAGAINSMAEHLQGYLHGQRQFMADFAHEIVSPIARMQIGIGILEAHVPAAGAPALEDVREDLEQMAQMLEELLLFSRSSLESSRTTPTVVALASVVSKVLESEASVASVQVDVGAELRILGHAPLVERALSNLVRNAHRYATMPGSPVEIVAVAEDDRIRVAVRDRGPGVPASALERLGEPFFRPQLDRNRATGGFGLGLAIVRRCAEANGGQVTFRNRVGGGFEAELDLPAATMGFQGREK